MSIKTLSKCPVCGFPINAEYEGQTAVCAYCGTSIQAITQEVTIPTWLLVGFIAFGIGVVAGPALIASTSEGARWLEKTAREKLAK